MFIKFIISLIGVLITVPALVIIATRSKRESFG